jgi:hypothetical protein
MGVRSAYQKMFEDGSAYKPIKIEQPSPENEMGRPMGGSHDPDGGGVDYSLFDEHMSSMIEEKISKKKSGGKTKMVNASKGTTNNISDKTVKNLERRIDILEQALQLVMETQTKLLRESTSNGEGIKTEKT